MKRFDFPQGSPAWIQARLGIPTASGFDRIVTPKTRKISASAEKYLFEKCAEWALGHPVTDVNTAFMDRGKGPLEDQAIATYAFDNRIEVDRVGFITTNDGRYGCSPDGLIGADGALEIKCLSAVNHIGALLGTADEYSLQIQGQMLVTGLSWVDRMYFNPTLPIVVQRVNRDEELVCILSGALRDFCDRLDEMKTKLRSMGVIPPAPTDFKALKIEMDEQAAEFNAYVDAGLPSPSNATLLGELQKQREARNAAGGTT